MTIHFSSIMVLTGAGISAESGVPVFRGDDGLWEGHRVEDVATADAIARNPWGVNNFFNILRAKSFNTKPNAAHLALARLEQKFTGSFLLVTQNVDALHVKAGSRNLIPMHGELLRVVCSACGKSSIFKEDIFPETACPVCNTTESLRPDIVLFGEMPKRTDEIMAALSSCDLFIAIGTSGFVYPAAGFVDIANSAGAHTIEVNTAATDRSPAFAEHIIGKASQTVPLLVARLLSVGSAWDNA